MPADMTTVIDDIAAEVADLYPGYQVLTSKRPAGDGPQGSAGWNEGSNSTCFVISGLEPESVDDSGTFDDVSVLYKVLVEYVKPYEKKVDTNAGRPPRVVEDADVRDKRQAIRRRIYKPELTNLPSVGNVKNRPMRAYGSAGGANTSLLASGQVFEFEVYEDRAE